MKHLLTLAIITIVVFSCRKEAKTDYGGKLLLNIKHQVKASIAQEEYARLDFNHAVQSRVNADTSYVRVPFSGHAEGQVFLLVQTNDDGLVLDGKIIAFRPAVSAAKQTGAIDGLISIEPMRDGQEILSKVENGFITALHPETNSKRTGMAPGLSLVAPVVPGPVYESLPEVIVVGIRRDGGSYDYGIWMCMSTMFVDGRGNGGDYYGQIGTLGGDYSSYIPSGGGGGVNSSGGETVDQSPPIVVDYERQALDPAIDLLQYLNCFESVPDAGANCSIEIFADIPVDSDPDKLLNWQTGSPGHVFLQLQKSNGSKLVVQNIGFYPEQGWKVILTPAPVSGKFVDNGGHEFNASLRMDVSPGQLRSAISEMIYLSRFARYDVDEYNCTDFALDVFNTVRNNKLEIPMYDVPGGLTATGTRTPQGLYHKLLDMQRSGGPEASNIRVAGVKGWTGSSSGPCN